MGDERLSFLMRVPFAAFAAPSRAGRWVRECGAGAFHARLNPEEASSVRYLGEVGIWLSTWSAKGGSCRESFPCGALRKRSSQHQPLAWCRSLR